MKDRIAEVTERIAARSRDGRARYLDRIESGASGKVPAAIHVTPEALDGGGLARVQDGDVIRVDAENGRLEILVDPAQFASRSPSTADLSANDVGVGRELFSVFRQAVGRADAGAAVF